MAYGEVYTARERSIPGAPDRRVGVPDVGEPAAGGSIVGVLPAVGRQDGSDEPDGRPDLLAPFADLLDRLVGLNVAVDVLDGRGDRPVDDAFDAVARPPPVGECIP